LSKITQAIKILVLSKCTTKARYMCKWKRVAFPLEQGGLEWPKEKVIQSESLNEVKRDI
jgi:hypothetical protein